MGGRDYRIRGIDERYLLKTKRFVSNLLDGESLICYITNRTKSSKRNSPDVFSGSFLKKVLLLTAMMLSGSDMEGDKYGRKKRLL